MLMDDLIEFCDKEYKENQTVFICDDCTHDEKSCPGSCEACLREVHFHYPEGRRDYTCKNIVNYYVCRYSNKYASEIKYALDLERDYLNTFKIFNILSIGCGPAPDLNAIVDFNQSLNRVSINYYGFDRNPLWKPIHTFINNYYGKGKTKTNFLNTDVMDYFKKQSWDNFNILILQYVISHFINTNQFSELETFFEDLTDKIIVNMNKPAVIIINDTNHFKMGRDHFQLLVNILNNKKVKNKIHRKFFDINIKSPQQRYGTPYESTELQYLIDEEITDEYCCDINNHCSSAQLIIELEGKA